MSSDAVTHPSSYRDPSGFIFEKGGVLYRQVNTVFKDDFDLFIQSGCYDELVKKKFLLPHRTINENLTSGADWYTTLLPEKIGFISYPYEWSFDMLKDAALLTLQLVKEAIPFGLLLKDANPYNIQWHEGKLIFIDTLSFEKYNERQPWIAYRQFCECFLGPLLLMHYSKTPLHPLLLAYPEGIPLTVIKALLPSRSRFSLYTYLHIHLHLTISIQNKNSGNKKSAFSKQKLLNLIDSLETLIKRLKFPEQESEWSGYYHEASRRNNYLEHKKNIVIEWIGQLTNIRTAADLGANQGEFSRLLSERNISVIAADSDPWCINNLYQKIKSAGLQNLQPFIVDLSNPSPATGVNNEERQSFVNRTKVDVVLALAIVHHLAIGKNIPFEKIARLLHRIANHIIVEFVPKTDEKAQLLLSQKPDIYRNYDEVAFEKAIKLYFTIENKIVIQGSERTLYLLKNS